MRQRDFLARLREPPRSCGCGRLVTAGRTTSVGPRVTRCLICETAAVMASFTWEPPRYGARKEGRRAAAKFS